MKRDKNSEGLFNIHIAQCPAYFMACLLKTSLLLKAATFSKNPTSTVKSCEHSPAMERLMAKPSQCNRKKTRKRQL
jgi:hypothetical protein